MHRIHELKVMYFGTPVVLIGSRNEDGTADLAPMSSAWWLGRCCMLGLDDTSQTTANLLRERECVLNLPSSAMADATAFQVEVVRVHVEEELIIPGTDHIDPLKWDPLIMKFCEFFGGAGNLRPSRLAEGWNMPHGLRQPV
ncbi:hypothetical protein Ppa06_36140 [Planomonospora parontospora subsp. parontospora]|uniref:Flavin reductase n=2 Tax=Planomonospora parontospora TaxID=58119 RepID=A0AA37F552_9ACTN|nr:hypothetical protein [Planomonospora parontospora]GGK70417.1 hypothetical protein GCM10010126_32300 [Planomonospora parontospora]GII09816.1 hypothetical protein Ppa06_36140 [Planomonospora parontospora subsp. parontospora]